MEYEGLHIIRPPYFYIFTASKYRRLTSTANYPPSLKPRRSDNRLGFRVPSNRLADHVRGSGPTRRGATLLPAPAEHPPSAITSTDTTGPRTRRVSFRRPLLTASRRAAHLVVCARPTPPSPFAGHAEPPPSLRDAPRTSPGIALIHHAGKKVEDRVSTL